MSATLTAPPRPQPTAPAGLPALANGDRLTVEEFLARYAGRPREERWELIEGEVFMSQALHVEAHGVPDNLIQTWLGVYAAKTGTCEIAGNTTVKLAAKSAPQPDCMLWILPEHGGKCRITEDDYLQGAPELVVEIGASSASLDAGKKLRSYERRGVREYLLWRTYDRAVEWRVLEGRKYRGLAPDAQGELRSPHLPGLCLDVPALLRHDRAAILATLEEGLR